MASLRETSAESQVGRAEPGLGSPAALLIWLVLVIPPAAAHLLLWRWFDAVKSGAGALSLISFCGIAIFAAIAVEMEFKALDTEPSDEEGRVERPHTKLAIGSLVVPLALSLLGVGFAWGPPNDPGSGLLLFSAAGAVLFLNAFCWTFAHFLVREALSGVRRHPRQPGGYTAFYLGRMQHPLGKYYAPIYPALTSMVMVTLFLFAFALKVAGRDSSPAPEWDGLLAAVVMFIIVLLSLLALLRYRSLLHTAKPEHIALAEPASGEPAAGTKWAIAAGFSILLICLAAAVMPLNELAGIGRLFRLQPPRLNVPTGGQPGSADAGMSLFYRLVAAGGAMNWLLRIAILLAFSVVIWLLRRRLRRLRAWQKARGFVSMLWARLKLWLTRLLGRRTATEEAILPAATPTDVRSAEALEAELLAGLTPQQAIIATFHLLLEYAAARGWLRRMNRPPFELLHTLIERTDLDMTDLSHLTWAYARAAFSQQVTSEAELQQVREAWRRLRPRLLPAENGTEAAPAASAAER